LDKGLSPFLPFFGRLPHAFSVVTGCFAAIPQMRDFRFAPWRGRLYLHYGGRQILYIVIQRILLPLPQAKIPTLTSEKVLQQSGLNESPTD
jgi:hypothetical protein